MFGNLLNREMKKAINLCDIMFKTENISSYRRIYIRYLHYQEIKQHDKMIYDFIGMCIFKKLAGVNVH